MSDTIFALSSGPAPAGIAVIRLSGPEALAALHSLLLRQPTGSQWVPQPRRAHRRKLYQPTFDTASDPDVLDDALVLYFPGPASFTGEDVVELHCHGGAATIAAVLKALGHYPGCRLAEAGEFSRRAFANGNMDLTEAEALADLIAAETEAQRRLALRLATGAGHDGYQDWTDRLIHILALIEAAVDFPEDDLPRDMLDQNTDAIATLVQEWQQDIRLGALSSAIRDGVRVAIVGSPNVGKSSLLNKLAGRDAAIVSEIAGTTRDVIEVRLDLGGYAVTLSDTAGLRDTPNVVEGEGVRRARSTAQTADIVLWVSDDPLVFDMPEPFGVLESVPVLQLLTKCDMVSAPSFWQNHAYRFGISSVTGIGLQDLLSAMTTICADKYGQATAAVAVRARHREALTRASDALEASLGQPELALSGEDVRVALMEMGRITGRVDVESVLDVVFQEFCIGK
jgi:tRNA modification GTPase